MLRCPRSGPPIERKSEMGFLRALEFLTIIPSFIKRETTPREVGRSLAYFPIIGLGIGGLLYGLDQLLQLALPSALANIMLLIALVALTGAHHLDGFIDTCDGMAAGRSPEERLAIMRDSRVGGLGVVGGCLLLLAKYVSLLVLPGGYRLEGLILMPVLSRWTMVYAIFGYPYAGGARGMGHAFKEEANWQRLAIATIVALGASLLLMKALGLVLMAAIWLILVMMAFFLKRRLGGLTGDTYGAINEMIEVCVLILVPVIADAYI